MAPDNRYTSGRRLILSILYLHVICLQFTNECDQTFVSRPGGPMNGTFRSPEFENPRGHSRNCVYIFLAGPGQRVQVTFVSFNLRGRPPDGAAVGDLPACVHEYLDVYAEVQQPNPAELVNTPFGGRYCGPIRPRRRVSLYRAMALSYHTDKNVSTDDIFVGKYEFINDTEYEIGTPQAGGPCNFLVKGAVKHTGSILSPTYPGAYPKAMQCAYQFLGAPGERIRLEFRDFDLFFGGPHCPFDFVKVYDGPDNSSAVIGTYCGQQRNLVIYSSESSLLVAFVTLPRTANTQNRGFKGIFEFSNSFTKLDFISKNDGEHIRGTECDQKILSKKESTGLVFSPNYPFLYMPKLVCRYFIYGLQDAQHLERVRLEFMMFEVPKGSKGDCSDGYLKIYLKGQETTDSYDKFDYEMCGDDGKPTVVVSDGPRLVMVFSSGELMGRGFKANYTFETEYKIPGTAAPDGSCSFTYLSTSKKRGEFNSPRYPSNYPSDTNCTYLFLATNNEQVSLVFDNFKIRADTVNTTIGSYGTTICQEDWVEIFNVYRNGVETKIGRYCHMSAPGPIESPLGSAGLKLVLHSDSEGVYSGFRARYSFETSKSIFGDCGGNVSSLDSGEINTPNFPKDYEAPPKDQASKSCNWFINVRPAYKVLLVFEKFAIEGDPLNRGCPAAVLRLWNDVNSTPVELCGEKAAEDRSWQYVSTTSSMRFSFITADKAVGAQGFRAHWTEVLEGPSCDEFQCTRSGFCIPEKLRCNRINNCGSDDDSDEENCAADEVPQETFRVSYAFIAGAALLCAVLLCVACHRKRRRRGRRAASAAAAAAAASLRRPVNVMPVPGTSRQPPIHFCEELGERFASVDSV